jgi:transcriptional regulator
MYVPAPFRPEDPSLAWDLVEEIRLGCLITAGGGLMASHLPFMVERTEPVRLIGHMARANPQWRALDGASVLVNFLGPNAHVSPGWYATSPRAPTWNYVAVQVRGKACLIEDSEALRAMVLKLSALMEPADSSWKAERLDSTYVDRLLPGIVGFEIDVQEVETQLRLSQQNSAEDQRRVREAFANGTARQRQVAEAMSRYLA